jgi:formamidopyrimidine-DNA glycosylase
MPELPEAETIRCQLEGEIVGAKVRGVSVRIARAAREHQSVGELARLVEGRRVERVGRRGKALLLYLDGKKPSTLIIRLGMTGVLRVVPAREPLDKHTAAVLALADGRHLRFVDQRQFGSLTARPGHDVDQLPEFRAYGPEPLSEEFTPQYLEQALARRSADLETVLMNQNVVSGIGKIYADEICFRAGLRPKRAANRLTRPMRLRLWHAIREVLASAIECRGSSARDETYTDVYGMPGSFQERLQVYQRAGEPCPLCGTGIRRAKMPGGRGMHWCPNCQK